MMKTCTFLFATLLSTALSAPAVVWHSGESNGRVLHSSEDLSSADLFKNVLSEAPEADLTAVVFLVGKGDDGSERLSELASSGKLPETFSKYNDASGVYHHVSGISSAGSVVREASQNDSKNRVLEVSLHEFSSKLAALESPVDVEIDANGTPKAVSSNKSVNKRARALAKADVYVVNVSPTHDAASTDASISKAINSSHVGSVVLSAVRSVEEVKHERMLYNKRRMLKQEEAGIKSLEARGRRRLEEAEDNANDDLSGVYYVAMTPNIFSGLLFTLMFIVVTFTGISCMGDIQGGDTFVDKYPSLGREA